MTRDKELDALVEQFGIACVQGRDLDTIAKIEPKRQALMAAISALRKERDRLRAARLPEGADMKCPKCGHAVSVKFQYAHLAPQEPTT